MTSGVIGCVPVGVGAGAAVIFETGVGSRRRLPVAILSQAWGRILRFASGASLGCARCAAAGQAVSLRT